MKLGAGWVPWLCINKFVLNAGESGLLKSSELIQINFNVLCAIFSVKLSSMLSFTRRESSSASTRLFWRSFSDSSKYHQYLQPLSTESMQSFFKSGYYFLKGMIQFYFLKGMVQSHMQSNHISFIIPRFNKVSLVPAPDKNFLPHLFPERDDTIAYSKQSHIFHYSQIRRSITGTCDLLSREIAITYVSFKVDNLLSYH